MRHDLYVVEKTRLKRATTTRIARTKDNLSSAPRFNTPKEQSSFFCVTRRTAAIFITPLCQ